MKKVFKKITFSFQKKKSTPKAFELETLRRYIWCILVLRKSLRFLFSIAALHYAIVPKRKDRKFKIEIKVSIENAKENGTKLNRYPNKQRKYAIRLEKLKLKIPF